MATYGSSGQYTWGVRDPTLGYGGGSPYFDEATGNTAPNLGSFGPSPDARPRYMPMDSGLMAGVPNYPQPRILGDSVVQQNPGVPFTAAQLATRRALIGDQAHEPSEFAGRPGVGRFPVASQGNIAIPISHRLNPSDISTDNFTLQGMLGVIGSGLLAGGLGGSAGMGGSGELSYAADPLAGAGGSVGAGSAGAGTLGAGSANFPSSITGPLVNFANRALSGSRSAAPSGAGGNGTSGMVSALPDLLGGAASLAGSNEALKAYEEAQRQAEAAGKFQPYNVFSGVGSTTFGPGGATSSLSPQYQALRDQYMGNANAGASAAGAFNPGQAANDLYGQLQAQAAPGESEQRANAIAQLQGMGTLGLGVGADTGAGPANPLYSSLLKAQADAGRQRQISAYGMAQDTANQMQQRALGWGGAGLGLDQSQLQQQQLGGYLGGIQSNAALGGAKLAQNPIMLQGAAKGGMLGFAGGALSGPGGANGAAMTYLQRLLSGGGGGIPGLPGAPPNFNGGMYGSGVDQYGNPIGGNFNGGMGGSDGTGFNDYYGDFGGATQFDPSVDWSSLYG